MASNVQTVLDALLADTRARTAPNTNPSDFFELFTAEQILKNYGLSYEELASGIVGHTVDTKGADGGIDSIYTFVNGILVTEDSAFDQLKQSVSIHLVIIQSKTTPGFSEDALLKLEATTKEVIDLGQDPKRYKQRYNANLIRALSNFHKAYNSLSAQLPELRISYYYATTADQLHPNVKNKAEHLKKTACRLFTGATCDVHFVDASELLTMSRKSKTEAIQLRVAEAMPTQSMGSICLVNLKDYYSFIIDADSKELRGWLFEENVRDYEGRNVDVNKGIRKSLEAPKPEEDFWWLNNGITIVANKAPMAGKTLTLEAPKIVNGLQTSTEIFNHFQRHAETMESRNILVRVIVTGDEHARNDIIKATNSQSAIKAASLRAFDPHQYTIEQFFSLKDLFYDRRKNYYKNLGKPKDKIISITYLAQAVAAIVLQRPNDARGRPANLIKSDDLYGQVFNPKHPVELYLECARFMKEIDLYLASDAAPNYIAGHEINVKFQLAMFAAAIKTKRLKITPRFLQEKGFGKLDAELLSASLQHVWEIFKSLKKGKRFDEDQVAKSSALDDALKERLREILITKKMELNRDKAERSTARPKV